MRIIVLSALFTVLILSGLKTSAQTPVASFTANPVIGCVPHVVYFTSTATGNPTSYYWTFGNGVTSTLPNPSTTYLNPGQYTVSLTVSNASGSNTKTITNYINVHPGPTVNFTGIALSGCPPLTVNFNNTTTSNVPGNITYSWQFGDGSPLASTQNPSHTYYTPGTYTVILTATDAQGCTKSKPVGNYVQVHAPPVINFSAPVNQCDVPATVNFTSTINGNAPYNYQWDFGDGGSATSANPTYTYNTPGIYTVRLIVTDANGCKDTLVKNNYMSIGNLVPNFTVSTGCEGTLLQFTNTSNLMDSVRWVFGDGTADTSRDPGHIYNSSGTFNVKLYVFYGNCKDSITKAVTVNPKPDAAYTFNPLHPCPAPSTIQFINQSTGATNYYWDFGDGVTSLAANPTHTYTHDTAFFPKLVAVSSLGCRDTSFLEDTVALYTALFSIDILNPYICVNDTMRFSYALESFYPFLYPNPRIVYPYAITSYYWDFGDGASSTSVLPEHVYTARGIYRASLTVTTTNGCTFTDTSLVLIGQKPTAGFTFSPDTVCNHGTITVVNTSINAQWFLWDFGNYGSFADTSAPGTFTHTYGYSGIDTIILYAFDYGCVDTFMANRPVVVHPPTALWDAKPFCDNPKKVQFYDTLSIDPTFHWWSFGDGDTSQMRNPVHTYPALGTYTVSLYTYNSIYGCTDTMTKTVTLIDPVLNFTTPDTAICEGDSIVFTPTYTTTSATGFRWYFNNFLRPYWPYYPFPYPDPNVSVGQWGYRFNKKGVYTVIVVAEDQLGCQDTAKHTILVAKPDAGFVAAPIYGCAPATINFTDTSKNIPGVFQVTREWDFGNGVITTNNPTTTNSYSAAGLYSVQLIVTDNVGCSDTTMTPNYIDIRDPVPAFSVNDSSACIGQLLAFTNQTTGTNKYTSMWYFGDGTTDTAKNPIHFYTQTGLYTVKLVIVDSIGCKDSMVKQNYITISKPTAQFVMSDTLSICPPLNVLFTNTSTGALSYSWSLGNGTTSVLQNPTAPYINPGIYQITLVAINAENCRDTAYGQIHVLGYSGALDYSPLKGCAPLTVGFKSQLYNIPSVVWDFSDGVTQPANGSDTTTHIYTTPGAYVPKLILSDNTGCQNSSPGTDTIKVDAVESGFITSPACVGVPVTFTDTSHSYFSPVTGWYWNFNNGQFIQNSSKPTLTFNNSGVFPVVFIATNANGCKDSLIANFTIFALPLIKAVSDTVICSGDQAQLSATGGIAYSWAPAATLSCNNCSAPVASPSDPSSYVVTGTDVNGCKNKDTVNVNIQYKTTSDIGIGGEICEDSSFQLLASGAHRYEWTPAESLNNNKIYNPIATPKITTTYTVIAWEGSCPPDTNSVVVKVHPKPTVDAGSDVTIVAGTSTMLNAKGSQIETYLWSPVATLSCDKCSNPYASPIITTQYKVTVTSQFGCRAYDTVVVRVLCNENQLYIPNTFSPNGDGQNDVFYPRGAGLKQVTSFRVYNRWGEKLFERKNIQLNDAANGWDGTYKGNLMSPDVFVYIIDALCDNGEPINWKGDITLLR